MLDPQEVKKRSITNGVLLVKLEQRNKKTRINHFEVRFTIIETT